MKKIIVYAEKTDWRRLDDVMQLVARAANAGACGLDYFDDRQDVEGNTWSGFLVNVPAMPKDREDGKINKDDILRLHGEGKTYKQIGQTLGCSPAYVCRIVKAGKEEQQQRKIAWQDVNANRVNLTEQVRERLEKAIGRAVGLYIDGGYSKPEMQDAWREITSNISTLGDLAGVDGMADMIGRIEKELAERKQRRQVAGIEPAEKINSNTVNKDRAANNEPKHTGQGVGGGKYKKGEVKPLTQEQREVCQMVLDKRIKRAEAAERLGVSLATIDRYIKRVRQG